PVRVRLSDASGQRLGGLSEADTFREIPYGDQLLLSDSGSARSSLTLVTKLDSPSYDLDLSAEADAALDLGIVLPDASGTLHQWRFSGVTLAAGARASAQLVPGGAAPALAIDDNGDGSVDRTMAATSELAIPDPPPQIVSATQIVPGFGPGGDKHGRNVAVLFSEKVDAATAKDAANYAVDANLVKTATLQPGGRMAFLLLRDGIGPFFERHLTVDGLIDTAGQAMSAPQTLTIRTTATGPAAVVDGVVREANGAPVPGATVRLMQQIWYDDGFSIEARWAIFSEKKADESGAFHFDYVLQNHDPSSPFMLEAVPPQGGEVGQLTTGVAFNGQHIGVDIFMKARGAVSGRVLDAQGQAVAGASVLITTLNDSRGYVQTTDATGAFSFVNLSVGAFRLKAVSTATSSEGLTMGTLPEEGGAVTQDVTLYPVSEAARGDISGKVLSADGVTPRAGAIVIIRGYHYQNWVRSGADGSFVFTGVNAGGVSLEARDDATGEQMMVQSTVEAGSAASVNLLLPGTGNIEGVVFREDGKAPEGLYVIASFGSYQRITRTDSIGKFSFDSVAVGEVNLKVLDPDDFNRQVASENVTLLSDGDQASVYLFVPDQALAVGGIRGTVYHRDGSVWPGATVRLTDLNNDTYIPFKADAQGNYEIQNLELNKPCALVVLGGSEVTNATVSLWYGGQVKTVDLHPFAMGTVTGTTFDDAEKTMPTGADVTLVSMKPDYRGWLVYDTGHPTVIKSDPQSGRFTFPGVYQGRFTVSTSNIFRPVPVSASGTIASEGQTVDLQLALQGTIDPDTGETEPINTMGSISGRVLLPDGTPAGAGVRLTTTFGGADVTVTTDETGAFHFSPIIPSGNRPLVALDPVSTLTWKGYVVVPAGGDIAVNPKLLGRGTLRVRALNADGTVAPDTTISVMGTAYPNDAASGQAGSDGTIAFANLSEGSYAVSAHGSFGRGGRTEAVLPSDGAAVTVEVRLAPSGTVTGTFYKADG
ncbi:MAG: carboxypeptidase-like regulatory domain-containing protein, partial [Desulfuromonadales bacterium]